MASQFGQLFRVATFGESHGGGVGVVVDGCPPRLAISADEIQRDLDRRRPGQSRLTTPRQERDQIEILSGVFQGQTLGTPIAMWVRNEDTRAEDYEQMRNFYRPSHADYTTEAKFGARNWQGGGRASARETVGRVAAGALARKLLAALAQIEVLAWVSKVHTIEVELDSEALKRLSREQIEAHPTRCPDAQKADLINQAIEKARDSGNSLGGVVSCVARGVPPGLGEPVFDKLEADLAHALLSLPATKGFEIGSGFGGTDMTGIQHNDEFYPDPSSKTKDYKKSKKSGKPPSLRTKTNYSGGVQGGISNGEPIELRVAFKPTSTINIKQKMMSRRGIGHNKHPVRGRHDPCVLPRAVPMVEAMVCLVLADHWLRQRALDALPR